MPCTASCVSACCAASTSWSHVTGWLGSSPTCSTTDFLYQSSCVLAQNGTATSSSFHVLCSTALATTPSLNCSARSSGTGARKPASAISGMYGGSRLISAMDSSWAASRRISCSRC